MQLHIVLNCNRLNPVKLFSFKKRSVSAYLNLPIIRSYSSQHLIFDRFILRSLSARYFVHIHIYFNCRMFCHFTWIGEYTCRHFIQKYLEKYISLDFVYILAIVALFFFNGFWSIKNSYTCASSLNRLPDNQNYQKSFETRVGAVIYFRNDNRIVQKLTLINSNLFSRIDYSSSNIHKFMSLKRRRNWQKSDIEMLFFYYIEKSVTFVYSFVPKRKC